MKILEIRREYFWRFSSSIKESSLRKFLLITTAVCCAALSTATAQDYPNSVASTDFDYIHQSDPSAFETLEYAGKLNSEMPDKRKNGKGLVQPAFVFVASFSDGTSLQISIDEAFENEKAAKTEAQRYVEPLGKLPTTLRSGVDRVVVHRGGKDSTAFSDNGLMVLYSDNASKRISNHDLEETVFHESVHASWDKKHANSKAWRKAQAQDAGFVTMYAKRNPDREDLAESALFAYTLVHHTDRIPKPDAEKILKAIPARIQFVCELIPPDKPIFYEVAKKKTVPKSAGEVSAPTCKVRIDQAGQLRDILSNVLLQKYDRKETAVVAFLKEACTKTDNAEKLFELTVKEFELDRIELCDRIKEMLHCNCDHSEHKETDAAAAKILEAWSSGG